MDSSLAVSLTFILLLSIFLGVELISKVPSTLHTPLMSGSNAISGITLLGAMSLAGNSDDPTMVVILGSLAVFLQHLMLSVVILSQTECLRCLKRKTINRI